LIKVLIIVLSALAASGASPAPERGCLPAVKTPAKWSRCNVDSDCVIAGDACRSCATPFVINKKFAADFLALDNKLRADAKCVIACEGCATNRFQIYCAKGICRAN
jgi:hypothetical protein